MKKQKKLAALVVAAIMVINHGVGVYAAEQRVKVDQRDIVIVKQESRVDAQALKAGKALATKLDDSIRALLNEKTFKISSEEIIFNGIAEAGDIEINTGGILSLKGQYNSQDGLYSYSIIDEWLNEEKVSTSLEDYMIGGKNFIKNQYTSGWESFGGFSFSMFDFTNYFMNAIGHIAGGSRANVNLSDETLELMGKYMYEGDETDFEGQQCRMIYMFFTHEDYVKEIAKQSAGISGLPGGNDYMEMPDGSKMIFSITVYISSESGARAGHSLDIDYYIPLGDMEMNSAHSIKTTFTDLGEPAPMPAGLPGSVVSER